ncbi:MAG: glutamine--tRNA ligase/YqeY domain fusion protein [Thermoanaerobaculaceae bacterium]|jgi:glutaminyl-tRNA synthetase|nr:glutamine--tRNA ligase/YqeY domain fusion protein [Thermoanaerobaculaceae bacterium]
MSDLPLPPATDFIREAINEDLASGRFDRVHTRFPPEPNGYLHIGHAKSICLNFGLAQAYGGKFNLRYDDTNPSKEEMEYVDSIKEDVRWLGGDWEDRELYASDYFEQLYEWAELLVRKGLAYVCDLSADEVREYRGTLIEPGRESPFRTRPAEENLDLLRRMRAGEFPDGSRTLRARIDMAHPNLNMRDPVLYRILRATHHRTGDAWCIYPMYDYAHGQSDSIEGITHSICTLEFEVHRPLYEWLIQAIGIYAPRQIEFARLNLTYTMMSKRKLLQLVQEGVVRGWDDPRMPTICGLRRRGYTPTAIRDFCARIGVAKRDSVVDVALLEHCLREELNRTAPRVMAVLRPLKLVLDNYPDGQTEEFDVQVNPESPDAGTRRVPFSKVLYIEQDDFREVPPLKYWRLFPGNEVRLRSAYLVRCTEVVKDPASGEVIEVHGTIDPDSRGGNAPDGRKIKSTIHWVSAPHAADAEVRLYEHLFTTPDPSDVPEGSDWRANLNPASAEILTACKVEPGLARAAAGDRFQFERLGYFVVDPDAAPGRLVFNRSVTLRDTWARIEKSQQ